MQAALCANARGAPYVDQTRRATCIDHQTQAPQQGPISFREACRFHEIGVEKKSSDVLPEAFVEARTEPIAAPDSAAAAIGPDVVPHDTASQERMMK